MGRISIGIDINCLIFEKAGFGRYTASLVENILKIDQKNQYILYASFIQHRAERQKILEDLIRKTGAKNAQIKIITIPAAWKEFLTGFNFPLQSLIKDPLDVYFAPHFAGIPKQGFKKMIVTIQDLVFMKYPDHRGKRLSNYYLKRTKIAIENSKQIIASSDSTRRDLVGLLGVPVRKIKVIHLGASPNFKIIKNQKELEAITKKYIRPKQKYILTVGTLEPRKNLSALIEAFVLLPNSLQREYKLMFVGAQGWNNDELGRIISDYNLKEKVIFPGFVKDEDLPYIYNKASIFIYPSLYEGFGLPPLEAMACGVPVIASGTSSLPEVIGKAGILVNPRKEEEIAKAMRYVLTNPKVAKQMIKKGSKQAKKFSWRKTAEETLKVFHKVVK